MTGIDVACDDEFTTGDGGQLRMRGVVRDTAWPYAGGGPSVGNGLFVDPDQGLWTPRRDPGVLDMEQTMSAGATTLGPGKQYQWPYQQATIVNPSGVQRMALLLTYFWEWTVDVASGAIADVQTSIIRLDTRVAANYKHAGTASNLTRSDTANPPWTWWDSKHKSDIEYLEAGATATYRAQIRVLCGTTGSLTAQSATVAIKGLGILL